MKNKAPTLSQLELDNTVSKLGMLKLINVLFSSWAEFTIIC